MIHRSEFRRWQYALSVCVIAVVVCVMYVDRPAAEFFNMHVRHTGVWEWIGRLLAPFEVVPVAALFFLLGSGCWVLSGRQLAGWTSKPLICSWSAVWALAAEFVFKEILAGGGQIRLTLRITSMGSGLYMQGRIGPRSPQARRRSPRQL